MTRRRGPRAGMTLLEVILASTLLALFFMSVFGIVFGTIETRDEIERKALPYSVGPVVLQRIVDDLSFFQAEAFESSKDVFEGTAPREEDTRLDFVAAVPSRDRVQVRDAWVRAGVNEVGYRLRRSEEDSSLYSLYRREDLGVDSDPSEGGRYFKLCDRVRRFTIDYFPEDPGDPTSDDAQGAQDWDARREGKMPWGCRITLVLAPDASDLDEEDARRDQPFQTYVVFRSRFDKADGTAKQPGK